MLIKHSHKFKPAWQRAYSELVQSLETDKKYIAGLNADLFTAVNKLLQAETGYNGTMELVSNVKYLRVRLKEAKHAFEKNVIKYKEILTHGTL